MKPLLLLVSLLTLTLSNVDECTKHNFQQSVHSFDCHSTPNCCFIEIRYFLGANEFHSKQCVYITNDADAVKNEMLKSIKDELYEFSIQQRDDWKKLKLIGQNYNKPYFERYPLMCVPEKENHNDPVCMNPGNNYNCLDVLADIDVFVIGSHSFLNPNRKVENPLDKAHYVVIGEKKYVVPANMMESQGDTFKDIQIIKIGKIEVENPNHPEIIAKIPNPFADYNYIEIGSVKYANPTNPPLIINVYTEVPDEPPETCEEQKEIQVDINCL